MLRRRVSCLIAALFLAAALPAQTDQTDAYIKARMDEFHCPGLSLAVVKDGAMVKAAGYGFADVGRKTAVTTDTVFKIGSVSKQFIATGIMLLLQDGRLSLDDPISKYLQGTPASWSPITIRHLLTHTAGLARESPAFDPNKVQSDAGVINAAYSVPLRFTPGAKWEYSNLGYFTLAEIIRVVSGQPWSEFLNQRVFKPAGLNATAATHVKPTLSNRALGYTGDDHRRIADDWLASRPSGAFLSTVLDLAKWDAVLYGDTILSDASRREMWTQVRLNDGTSHPYGLGWHVENRQGRRVVWHGGGLPGFTAHYVRFLDNRSSVIVLANGDDSDMAAIANGVAMLYLPASPKTGLH